MLILPKDKSETATNVNIQWKKVINANNYSLQISTDIDFNKIIQKIDNINDIKYTINDLQENQTYFWRVKAYSKFDSSKWSIPRQFNVVEFRKIVQLLYPANDDLQIPLNGYLEWNNIDGADFYSIQLADNIDFENPIISVENFDQLKIAYSALNFNTDYFWRVRYSSSDNLSDWSETWSFKTKNSRSLDFPSITSHQSGSKGFPIVGKITWNEISNASEYQISISLNSNFSTIFYKKSDIVETEFYYPILNYSTTYYIRISASNESAHSSWSVPIEITTELEAPKIDKSMDGLSNIPLIGRINWTTNENDHWYRILIARNESFDDLVVDNSNFEKNYYDFNLDNNTTYYCKVKTYNDSNFSNWSETISFTTEKITSVNDIFEFENIRIYPNPANEYIIISLPNYQEEKILMVTDLLGNTIINKTSTKENLINITSLPKGMYLVKVNNKTSFFIKD